MATAGESVSPELPSTHLKALLADFREDADSSAPLPAQKAVFLAKHLQERAASLQTPQEKKQQRELERMMKMPHDKATLMQMTDQTFRSKRSARAVEQLIHILDVQGIPRFFSPIDRTLLKGFQSFGGYLPGVSGPMVREKMREETANVILPAEDEHLLPHLSARRDAGLRMNVNLLGEALLGEDAAQARLETYLEALQRPEIECISIKISTIFSQISSIAWEQSVDVLCDRLELLYREAARMQCRRPDGSTGPKFVYLDMEEYRDMNVTAEAFMRTLERPGLEHVGAGIALQAYLPDSWAVQKRINRWARHRLEAGGAPVTIRLVKGANMEMEKVEACLHGWPQANLKSKLEVDANFKRMLHEGMREENIAAVRLGIASHNLFDLAYSLVMADELGYEDKVQYEMLEGMSNHQRRALCEVADDVLLYAPATRKEHFSHAIGYLVRRLDENTGPDNFLSHAFKLEVDSDEWRDLEAQFLAAFDLIDSLPEGPRRTQNRNLPVEEPGEDDLALSAFSNEPDTDFALPHNVEWARNVMDSWGSRHGEEAADIPLMIAGEKIRDGREVRACFDPSRPGTIVGRYHEADENDIDNAVACARRDSTGWRTMKPADRAAVLGKVAHELRARRGDLLGAALVDGGKTFLESDPEVSEAVDFVEYYRRSACQWQTMESVDVEAKGVVVVVAPWNFPVAIPCGGIAAALAAGNCVILKPASDTVLAAYELCKAFWDAGISGEVLQFAPCAGSGAGAALVSHDDVDSVILTGGTETAFAMLDGKPDLNLLAETGGKNATIVTAMADRDQAIKNVLQSAFGHSGQKCSATSLLILEDEVYNDPEFKTALCDAVKSLHVGSAWDLRTRVGPLIRPPTGDLERGLKELEAGESWVVMPGKVEGNPHLWTPGVKWGVTAGTFTHLTELFGPVLGVMRATDLDHAIDLVNQTGYGLTSGIESLDERERDVWLSRVRAGNLYINRGTTGAIVLRQPFGGMGKSAFGPGIKAGGPNYVAQFMNFSDRNTAEPDERPQDTMLGDLWDRLAENRDRVKDVSAGEADSVLAAFGSYCENVREEFEHEHDSFKLLGQDNIRRYLPVRELRIRIHPQDSFFELFARVGAARAVGSRITISVPPDVTIPGLRELETWTESWGGAIEFVVESDTELAGAILSGQTDRVRFAAPYRVPRAVHEAVRQCGQYVAHSPVLAEGRIELLWYVQEQSVSNNYHRYGNLGETGAKGRASVL